MIFTTLFTQMGIATIVLLAVGLALLVIELMTPGFGVFGTLGIICLLAALILRVTLDTTEHPAAHFFLMLLFILIVIGIFFAFFVLASKKGWLDKTFIVEKGVAVSTGISEGTRDFTALVGLSGIAATALRPGGIAVIDGKRYDVITEGEFIEKGGALTVIGVEGVRIVVKAHSESAENIEEA
ncbi:MAG: NfeD family protein [Christensenellales bacterium]